MKNLILMILAAIALPFLVCIVVAWMVSPEKGYFFGHLDLEFVGWYIAALVAEGVIILYVLIKSVEAVDKADADADHDY